MGSIHLEHLGYIYRQKHKEPCLALLTSVLGLLSFQLGLSRAYGIGVTHSRREGENIRTKRGEDSGVLCNNANVLFNI